MADGLGAGGYCGHFLEADAVQEIVEPFRRVGSAFLVVGDDFFEHRGRHFGGDFDFGDAGADAGILNAVVAVVAAEEQLVGGDLLAVCALDGGAVKADVGDVMEAAAVGAAAHFDADVLHAGVVNQAVPAGHFRPQGAGQAH